MDIKPPPFAEKVEQSKPNSPGILSASLLTTSKKPESVVWVSLKLSDSKLGLDDRPLESYNISNNQLY
ncbi:hypothetical protein T07_14528 [Trichinella nelsoni]|uniref:Uncharacterized protein n=1 Tax=Trichinella nelsoni TaxID=6336 RepID=A0A0V0RQ72_9BILA|nr:hypothetical protein T07_14528 [Trichinella nelsoni]